MKTSQKNGKIAVHRNDNVENTEQSTQNIFVSPYSFSVYDTLLIT